MNSSDSELIREAWIYGLVDMRDGLLYYVGQTVNLKQRYSEHLRDTLRVYNPKVMWICDLQENGLVPYPILLAHVENTTQQELDTLEFAFIRAACDACMPLTNGEIYSIAYFDYVSPYMLQREPVISNSFKRMKSRLASHLLSEEAEELEQERFTIQAEIDYRQSETIGKAIDSNPYGA